MKLLTQDLIDRFNEIGDQSEIHNPLIITKFFDPVGSATWYATQYNPETNICNGYVAGLVSDEHGRFDEWGTFSIDELESLKLPFGLTIERDLHFKEILLGELIKKNRLLRLEQDQSPKNKTQELER